MTDRSLLAFKVLHVYSEDFQDAMRKRLKRGDWVLPQGAVKKISRQIPKDDGADIPEHYELDDAA
jgi:hypothetical protein